MAAEAGQHQMCADILSQAASFGTNTAPAAGQPSRTEAAQAASLILDPRGMFTTQHAQPGHRPEDHQQALPGTMPGLFPLLANMQGQTNAMLHLNMQPAHMYGYNPLPPVLSAPAPFRAGPPTDAASIAASQRASMESASTSHTRPSLDDASMLSRLYPSSSLESSFSLNRMSIDDPQHRMSSGSRRSSVSVPFIAAWPSLTLVHLDQAAHCFNHAAFMQCTCHVLAYMQLLLFCFQEWHFLSIQAICGQHDQSQKFQPECDAASVLRAFLTAVFTV